MFYGLGKGSGKMQWPTMTRITAMALFLLLQQELKTTSTNQLFCLPFNCSFQGNCPFGLFELSPLHFRKALQSPNYKTNVCITEMIYHLEGHSGFSFFAPQVQHAIKGLRTTQLRSEIQSASLFMPTQVRHIPFYSSVSP